MIEANIGSELALRRHLCGLRQYKVAQEVGLCPSVLSDFERGVKKPSPELIERILAAIERLAGGTVNG